MNRTIFVLAAAAAAGCALPASAETRTFNLPEFDSLDASAGIRVIATVGGDQSIQVETEDGDFSDFQIEVKDGELSVSREWNRLRWHQKKAEYTVTISVRQLKAFDGSSGSITTLQKIDARTFSVDLSSGAFAIIGGRSDNCSVDISSGANLNAEALVCDTATVDVSSGGHGELTVSQALNGDASTGGHVAIFGNPERVNLDHSSGGRIKVITPAQAKSE